MRHIVMLGLIVVSSIGLGTASIELHQKMQPPRLSMKEMIAIRRYEAHEAAVARNAIGRQLCTVANAVRPATFAPLYGEFPATVGDRYAIADWWSKIDDVVVRTERRDGELVDIRALVTPHASECWPSEDPEVFCPFRCQPDPHDDCMHLSWQLAERWGRTENVWRDLANGIQARVIDGRDCELRFQRYVEPSRWIAMSLDAEVPLALIGEPAWRLRDYPNDNGGWKLLVTGEHMLEARIETQTRGDRIIGFTVYGEMEEAGGADELYALVGRYARMPLRVELYTAGTTFELRAGDVP